MARRYLHPFAPHAIEVHQLRRRALWARVILVIGLACASFWGGYFCAGL